MARFPRAMGGSDRHHLPRLDRRCYQAFAAVHWRMRVEPRDPGWLGEGLHLQFRELLVHACSRERLVSPVYCLMPDHLHLMLLGLAVASDQLNAVKFLRTHLNRLLAGETLQRRDLRPPPATSVVRLPGGLPGWRLQAQAFDHVLRAEERQRDAFARVCFYILANPVRAGLVVQEPDWPFSGAAVPGYPDLHPCREGYWELFWRLCGSMREATPTEASAG